VKQENEVYLQPGILVVKKRIEGKGRGKRNTFQHGIERLKKKKNLPNRKINVRTLP